MKKILILLFLVVAIGASAQNQGDINATSLRVMGDTVVTQSDLLDTADTKEIVLGWVDDNAKPDIVIESELYNGDVLSVTMGFSKTQMIARSLDNGYVRYNSFQLYDESVVSKIRIPIYTAGVFTDDGSAIGIYSVASDGAMTLVASYVSGDFLKTAGFIDVTLAASATLQRGCYVYAILYKNSAQTTAPRTTGGSQGLGTANRWGSALFGASSNIVAGYRTSQTELEATMNVSDITSSTQFYDAVICE